MMTYSPDIFLIIICSFTAGCVIPLAYLRLKKKAFPRKSPEHDDHLGIVGHNLAGGMLFRIVCGKDGSRKFLYVSPGIRDIHGLTPEKVLADASLLYRQVHPEDRDGMMETEKHAVDNMMRFDTETRIINERGETRWIRSWRQAGLTTHLE